MIKKLMSQNGFDFWVHSRRNASKIMVAPHVQDEFERYMSDTGIDTTVRVSILILCESGC